MTTFHFQIGAFKCHILPDAGRRTDAGILFSNAPTDELEAALKDHDSDGGLYNIFGCLLIETGEENILVDAGMGKAFPETGKLLEHLAALNISPEAINTLIITHAHPDHIIGLLNDDGELAFPNASYVMWHAEWEFWTDEAQLAALPEGRTAAARKYLPPIASKLELATEDGETIRPGIFAMPTPGHSPGHLALLIKSEGEEFCFLGDAILHPLHIEQPNWVAEYDMDRSLVVETRRRLIEQCAQHGWLTTGYHFAPAGIGRIEEVEAGKYRWTRG